MIQRWLQRFQLHQRKKSKIDLERQTVHRVKSDTQRDEFPNKICRLPLFVSFLSRFYLFLEAQMAPFLLQLETHAFTRCINNYSKEANQQLKSRIPNSEDYVKDARTRIHKLKYLSLAISHAAAYRRKWTACSKMHQNASNRPF